MPPKKKNAKAATGASKEELPDPATLKNGASTAFIGGWSSHSTVDSLGTVSAQLTAAHTSADGSVEALPRTNILLLPFEDAAAAAASEHAAQSHAAAAPPSVVEVADKMNIEGVSRYQCAQQYTSLKTWAGASAAAATADNDGDNGQLEEAGNQGQDGEDAPRAPDEGDAGDGADAENPYADALDDVRYTQTVAVGASYAAKDVVISAGCSIEGMPPRIVVPPQLPDKPDLDAVTLDPVAEGGAAGDGGGGAAGEAGGKPRKAASGNKAAKKGKAKLTPEQIEELERKKAALEAEHLQQTELAVQRAQEEADYLMTFAHPDRWASVVFRHITFAGPVVVRRAHVSFQNCRFASHAPDRPQLVVSQYCRVQCTKCTFEAPRRCGLYAFPSSQVEVNKCLFSGVPQRALWAAEVPGVSPHSTAAAGGDGADAGGEEEGHDGNDGHHAGKHASAMGFSLTLNVEAKAAVQSALLECGSAVGIQIDSAKLRVKSCDFVALGVGTYIRGCYTGYVTRQAVAPKSAQQLTAEACDVVLESSSFHYVANTAVLLDKTARLVALRDNYVEACTHYGLDCQGGVKSVMVRNNHFAASAAVRIREGATVAMLHNDFQSIPVNDNPRENPCLQPVY